MFPIALQSLMLASVAAGDAIMLGRIEQNAMAAVSLASQIQFVQNIILAAITSTIVILAAQYWGKQDLEKVNDIFLIGLRVTAAVSCVFFLGCTLTPDFLMSLFTNEDVLIEIGSGYLRIAGWSYLLTGVSQSYLALMKVSEHAGRTALISTVTVVLNLILNGILIYGLLGAPRMGANGAAAATLTARIIELVWAVMSSYEKGFVKPKLRRIFHRDRLLSGDFRKITLPLMGASLLWGVGFTSYTAFIGHMGTDAAAANSISTVIRDLMCCLCNGISAAGGIMIGYELGAGKLKQGKIYGIRLAKLSIINGLATTVIILLLTPVVLRFMVLTPEARRLLIYMMVIMAFYMIGRCINTVVINGIFDSGGDTLFDMYSLVVMMWIVAIPLAFLGAFVFHWSPILVYACTCLDEVGKLPWVFAHFKKYLWVKDLTR
ncbi:MAG: MATE family efflux transporter [Eubacteriales bacterium]|nr:MATE family efflux transporter [Eubacteriales bacterium]